MIKKIVIALTVPVLGLGVYFGLGVLMPVAEPTIGGDVDIFDKMEESIKDVTISADYDYLSMSVNSLEIKVDASKNQEKGGDGK